MSKPLLTIGMAHYDDFRGLWPTIQSIRNRNPDLVRKFQFLVVNNQPEDRATADAIQNLLKRTEETGHRSIYVELANTRGTSPARNAIFDHAEGEYVAVMDCHVEITNRILRPEIYHTAPPRNTFEPLLDHYRENPGTRDIISGPLLHDNGLNVSTHFEDIWSDTMWGQWGVAWQCNCGPDGSLFSLINHKGRTHARTLKLDPSPITACAKCGKEIPALSWPGHEAALAALGFRSLGTDEGPAFEIPGQGLGFFSCRRDAWREFPRDAKNFGAEELCIHEKFRQAGARALCLPAMKWQHRFYREGGHRYPNTNFDKCRNYVLWFKQLGRDLTPIRTHFVDTPIQSYLRQDPPQTLYYVSELAWKALVEDPVGTTTDPTDSLKELETAALLLPDLKTVEAVFDDVHARPRDLEQHMPALRALAENCDTVVEMTGRRESTVAFLAGRPKKLVSFTTETDHHTRKAAALVTDSTRYQKHALTAMEPPTVIPETDLLFVDTVHTYPYVLSLLHRYVAACRRWIVLHDTEVFGARGEDGGLGLRHAIAEFCDTHRDFAVVDHNPQQYGLTVLSRNLDDRPETAVAGFNVPAGPGTELKKILHSLGINPSPECSCNRRAMQMDAWGADGCEAPENFATIVGWLKERTWKDLDITGAVAKAFFTGIAWELNPLDPYSSLVKLCIKRARETDARRAAAAAERLDRAA